MQRSRLKYNIEEVPHGTPFRDIHVRISDSCEITELLETSVVLENSILRIWVVGERDYSKSSRTKHSSIVIFFLISRSASTISRGRGSMMVEPLQQVCSLQIQWFSCSIYSYLVLELQNSESGPYFLNKKRPISSFILFVFSLSITYAGSLCVPCCEIMDQVVVVDSICEVTCPLKE